MNGRPSKLQKEMADLIAAELKRRAISHEKFGREIVFISPTHVRAVLKGQSGAHPGTLTVWANALGMEWQIALVPKNK